MRFQRKRLIHGFTLFIALITSSLANVEKIVFLAPAPLHLPHDASIDNLLLDALHPGRLSLRTHLNVSFPRNAKPRGEETWLLLDGLTPNRRYELRICWLATQPTAFWIDTFTVNEGLERPDLITSLSTYSYARHAVLSQSDIQATQEQRSNPTSKPGTSALFLRVQAAADYFTLNQTLMEKVPPVHADIILDPYLLNVFPQSLVPTAGYIVTIAGLAWFVSKWASRQLLGDSQDDAAVANSKMKKP